MWRWLDGLTKRYCLRAQAERCQSPSLVISFPPPSRASARFPWKQFAPNNITRAAKSDFTCECSPLWNLILPLASALTYYHHFIAVPLFIIHISPNTKIDSCAFHARHWHSWALCWAHRRKSQSRSLWRTKLNRNGEYMYILSNADEKWLLETFKWI